MPHPSTEQAFKAGWDCRSGAENPFLYSSECFEAFELGRTLRPIFPSCALVHPSRGSSWRVETKEGGSYVWRFSYRKGGSYTLARDVPGRRAS